jgi:protein-S-isoprenylcysteine O-methyltransferase Ste14
MEPSEFKGSRQVREPGAAPVNMLSRRRITDLASRVAMTSRAIAWSESAVLFALLYIGIPWASLRLEDLLGIPRLPSWASIAGLPLAIVGAVGLAWCFALFAGHGGGTPNPILPPRRLVTTGPYAFTRNPIILFHAATLLGLALLVGSSLAMVLTFALAVPAHFIVLLEERTLEARFGADYRVYKASVPRWLGPKRRHR